ncbi:MAG: DUF1775 domain-containing protein [Acidobacteria bacterium]|nr:DUF1775 domain-containing protein [Acidobacteriota bacterium]
MRAAVILCGVVLAASAAFAHVTVRPQQSRAGTEERYTVRVPTEGRVTTTSVELEVPADMTVTEVVAGSGYTFETRREGNRVVAIIWKQDIPPRAVGEFVFVARNPAKDGPVAWKARQRFADGTSADWVGVEGDRRPAAVTTIVAAP